MRVHPYIDNVKDLNLKLRELLSEELGVFGNGQPAIFVEPPAAPKGNVTGGVQCIINRYRNVLKAEPLLNDLGGEAYEWIVVITLYEINDETLLQFDNCIKKMRETFPLRRETVLPWGDKIYPMVTYRLAGYEIHCSR
jgi:hypothetical protein